MGKAWVKARRRDPYYRRAKSHGYRSRAAFKLIQVDGRFDLIYEGDVVVDLGAAPGGWSQVLKELVGEAGRVVAVDRVGMRPLEGVEVWRGDTTDSAFVEGFVAKVGKVDAVLSDMAPRLSGTRTVDHQRSLDLARAALALAVRILRPKGNFLVKVFQGDSFEAFRGEVATHFRDSRVHAPAASRQESRETYIVGKDFRG